MNANAIDFMTACGKEILLTSRRAHCPRRGVLGAVWLACCDAQATGAALDPADRVLRQRICNRALDSLRPRKFERTHVLTVGDPSVTNGRGPSLAWLADAAATKRRRWAKGRK